MRFRGLVNDTQFEACSQVGFDLYNTSAMIFGGPLLLVYLNKSFSSDRGKWHVERRHGSGLSKVACAQDCSKIIETTWWCQRHTYGCYSELPVDARSAQAFSKAAPPE